MVMKICLGYTIETQQPAPTPMVLMLYVRPDVLPHLTTPDTLGVSPDVPVHEYTDSFGNRCARIIAPPGVITFSTDALLTTDDAPDPVVPDAIQHRIEDLPDDCLQFLLGSRYCEVDKLSKFAWDTFGGAPLGWGRVQAVNDFVHKHVTFGYQFASSTKTAEDVLAEGRGVCRDYQHLAVTLCRALGIPARYATGYLGDLRIPPVVGPMDFSAWYEVFLGGQWHAFDARYNTPRVGRTLMAVGRDAADVALITTFGAHALNKFVVVCEEIKSA